MLLPYLALFALILAILIGAFKPKINIGLVAITFALVLGYYFFDLKEKEIAGFFPTHLFMMLVGITALFGIANENGALNVLTQKITKSVGKNKKMIPFVFFLLAFALSALGPGNIASVALIAPIAIITAVRNKSSVFLMSIMVCTGANAGAFSPIAPTGIILLGLMDKINLDTANLPWVVFLASAVIQSLSALLAFFVLRKYKNNPTEEEILEEGEGIEAIEEQKNLNKEQTLTLLAILLLVVSVAIFKVPISIASFTLALVLMFLVRVEDLIKQIPWDAILLVSGVMVLIGLLEKSGALTLAVNFLATISTSSSINGVLAFVSGIVSAYSSSSGIVLPAFVPLLPGLEEQLVGSNITNMLIAVAVGSHMVDVSPLSTLGALCIACMPKKHRAELFKNLMIWGVGMAFVGAFLSFIILDLIF